MLPARVSGCSRKESAGASVVGAVSGYPDLAPDQTATNGSPFVIALSPSHLCAAPVVLRLTLTSDSGLYSGSLDPGAFPGGRPGSTTTFSRTAIGAAITIGSYYQKAFAGQFVDLFFIAGDELPVVLNIHSQSIAFQLCYRISFRINGEGVD